MRERGLEQHVSADDIGVDEFRRPVDRAVDMAFRRQMHHRVGIEARKNISDGRAIADIGPAEMIARMALHRSQRGEIAGIGQLVDDQHLVIGMADEMSDQRRPDESRPTGDDNLHVECLAAISRSLHQSTERMAIIVKRAGEFLQKRMPPVPVR